LLLYYYLRLVELSDNKQKLADHSHPVLSNLIQSLEWSNLYV